MPADRSMKGPSPLPDVHARCAPDRREGLCTTLCKWNRAALVAIDDVYADPDLDDVACGKRCRATAAVVNPGQCRFFACACGDCPAAKMKYATQVQCQKACSGTCVQLYGFVSGADSVHGCTREVASSNPGKGRL